MSLFIDMVLPRERRLATLVAGGVSLAMGAGTGLYALEGALGKLSPWHAVAMGVAGAEEVEQGTAAVLFSLYRVMGWSGVAASVACFLLSTQLLRGPRDSREHWVAWLAVALMQGLTLFWSMREAFRVGPAAPWYAPGAGLVAGQAALWSGSLRPAWRLKTQ